MHVIIAAEVSTSNGHSFLNLHGLDGVDELLFLEKCSSVGSESMSGMLDGLLLLGLDTGSNHFHHSLLHWGEASDFSNDASDSEVSLGVLSLSGDWSELSVLGWSGDKLTVVKSDEDSASVVGFTHVFDTLQK